jgi:cytochrome c peroxidase
MSISSSFNRAGSGRSRAGAAALVLAAAAAFSLGGEYASLTSAAPVALASSAKWGGEPIKPIPTETSLDARKVTLGRLLFHEPRLSRDNSISCASCHDLGKGGTDRLRRSTGIDRNEGAINAPTVFNSGLNFKQFWDGRADSLEEQVNGPVLDPHEMGSSWPMVVKKLRTAPEYAATFAKLYQDGVQPANVRDALAEFERSLLTPNSRFDKYLRGDAAALSVEEKEGYRKFKAYGCVSCHQGVNVGGNMFETLGAMADYFAERGNVTGADFGRFNVTGREGDRFVFKVPGLRNVALTAPYFHDGSVERLEDAVAAMGKFQLGQTLSDEDIAQIVKFLGTLTGEYGGRSL